MTDKLSKKDRRKTMQAVRSKNTKLENMVIKQLWKLGYRFRRNVDALLGKPDIAIKKYKIVIFIDSCFWHGCNQHCRMPSSNKEYWYKKIQRNKNRDKEITEYYINNEWRILRIWEHQIKEDFNNTIKLLTDFIDAYKNNL
ncbi:MAG TPA: very short patch repair endonuclease [Candidatus Gastranaerophilales bacterium]|nr:very short patch repair endonuclease [Candidatus Gastranaerophilales bacterium]